MADKAPDDEKEAKKKKGVGGFLAIADLSTSLGTGTFVLSRYTRNPYLDWTLSLMPAYEFSDRTRISVMAAVNQELTNTDAPDTPREFDLSDVRLGITRPIYTFDGPKTTIAGELYGYAPVSEISRGEGLRTAAEARLGVTQPWGDWAFSFRTAYRKNFHEYTSPVKDIDPDQVIPDCIAREGGNERVNAFTCSAGGNNVSFLINNRLSASWSVSEKVTLGASYALAHAWTYEGYDVDSECDPSEGFACPVSGVGAREGRGRRDAQDGRLFGSYSLRDNLDLTGGLVTVSSPRSEDDRRLRFPFLATEGQALNLTMIFFSVTFTEPFPIGSESSEETHAKLQSR